MKNLTLAGIFAIPFSLLFACKKSTEVHPTGATLTITQPVLNQTYRLGDTVHIECIASNVTDLHGCHVAILNVTNDTLYHEHDHTHAKELHIQKMWVNDQTTAQDMKVIVSCPINHEGEELRKEILINIQP